MSRTKPNYVCRLKNKQQRCKLIISKKIKNKKTVSLKSFFSFMRDGSLHSNEIKKTARKDATVFVISSERFLYLCFCLWSAWPFEEGGATVEKGEVTYFCTSQDSAVFVYDDSCEVGCLCCQGGAYGNRISSHPTQS